MDSYFLTSNAGSQINIGSYLLKDPGPDFGLKDFIRHVISKNPKSEAGALAFDDTSLRLLSFPLRLASSGAFAQGLTGAESFLRGAAQPGGTIDLQPDGVATGDMVRFDIISGRYETAYTVDMNRLDRRDGFLYLDVKPFGYSPSLITLASTASVGLPGTLALVGLVIGDAMGLAEVVAQPTVATTYPAGSWVTDFVAWSVAARPSFVAYWPAASMASTIAGGTAVTDAFAPGGKAIQLALSKSLAWSRVAVGTIPMALEPAYRGRHRVFGLAKWGTDQTQPFYLAADAAVMPSAPFASWAQVATLYTRAAFAGSPGYQVLDFGELALPPGASGLPQDLQLRVWAAAPQTMTATPQVQLGGLYLLPLSGPGGVLPRGVAQPALAAAAPGKAVFLTTDRRRSFVSAATNALGSYYPMAETHANYRGGLPYVAASTVQVDGFAAQRNAAGSAGSPVALAAPPAASVSLTYQPRFYFLKSV